MPTKSLLLFPDLNQPVTRALRPMQISGAVAPVVDADGGINIAVVEESANGVLCVIVAYLDMLEGDKNVVYWDDVPVLTRMVEAGEKDKHLFFYLPKALFSPGLHECFYELTRFGETAPDDPSVLSLFRIKLTSPGGRDREPHLPDGHSELHIAQLPQEIIDQGVIDAEWAKKGIPLTVRAYPEITLRDTILMRWGSHTLAPHLVTQAQAEGKDPIVIVAKQEDILAGGDSPTLEIKYDPHDEVWNWSSRHSKRTRIAVDAGAWRLQAPIIKESVNGIITIINLNKENVTVQVPIAGSDFALKDSIEMTWIGTPFTGKPLIHTETKLVESIPSVLPFEVPYAQVRAIAMGRADASYVLTKADGSPPLSSKREFADVVGDVSMPDAPTILELLGDILEPHRPYATVRIGYAAIANGDLVAGHWIGEKSNGHPYVHEFTHAVSDNEAKEGFFTVDVGAEHINVLDNGRLDLWYTVSNDKPEFYGISDSEHLLVRVQGVTATLRRPEVEEAGKNPDVLDPSKVFDVVHIFIENPPTQKDDIVTWYWQATHPFGSISDWVPITSLSAGKPLRFRVPAEYVTRNIGQYVKVRYSLKHATTGLYSHSAVLDLLIGSLVGELPPPQVKQAPNAILKAMDGLNGVDVNVSYDTMDPALDIIPLHWIGTPGAGTSTDLELPGHSSGSVNFHLPLTIIGPNINKTVDVKYFVRRYGHETESESLGLRVTGFDDPENDLPRPQVRQSANQILDLMTFSGDANTLVSKWHYIALKQRIWLRLEGKTAAGSDHVIRMLDGVEITPAQVSSGLNEVLLRSELMKLGHSTPANVICKVSFDGTNQEVNAIEFPKLSLTIRTRYDWLTPKITHVTDANGEVTEGGETFFEQVTIKGTATRDEKVEIFDGSTSHGNVDVGVDGIWSKTLLNLQIKDYHITAHALYAADPVSSLIRAFTVKAAVPPTITNAQDSKGTVIPDRGTTVDTTVKLTGSASEGEQVEIFDGAASKGNATADPSTGIWTKDLTGLSVATHSFTAKALYGAGQTSGARTLTVTAVVAPTITNAQDSKGTVIPDRGTTVDTTVKLTGSASKGEQVEIFDGAASKGNATADPSTGIWTKDLTGLSVAAHSFTAKALYGAGQTSGARTLTVTAVVAPTITNAQDSKSTVIPDRGTTVDTTVKLTGSASKGEQVEIFDGAASKGNATADPSTGIWTKDLTGLSVAAHSFTAKALYGAGQTSGARTLTVTAVVAPTITNAQDSKGTVIPDRGTTVDTTVKLTGSASKGEQVEIFDGAASKGNATADPSTGIWTKDLTGLSVAAHSFTAKALYGAGQTSGARTLTVEVHTAPSLDSVRDSRGELQNNGATTDTSVALQGRVTPLHQVQIYDGGTPKHNTTALSTGIWTTTLAVGLGGHTITARAVTTGQTSNARTFTVNSPIPPLNFNTSPVTLSGKIYLIPGSPQTLPAFGPGTSVQHQASGGQPSYRYSSENTAVAHVDGGNGLVTVRGLGTTRITVTDAANQTKSYTVTVTGVIQCIALGSNWWSHIMDAARNQGARVPSLGELREIHSAYGGRWPLGNGMYWTWEERPVPINPNPFYHCKNLVTGAENHHMAITIQLGVGIKP
ncbi:Ig-like domain repeat protein [Pseudomonas kribbensis]|uniref:Ig-like domain repeat protein n=1 Tax=Pseudomonas kribbensis TaxID=1628086 RepID=UPI001F261AEC|nr:Ig-like domain repeat protein [Pseudomonas kribbensis]UIN52672.1 Ig-like domain repeat protein [Pseudomonas kribbensis]